MTLGESPFTPGRPVDLEFFAGRAEQLQCLLDMSERAAAKRHPQLAYISGERGIGKSSLARGMRMRLGRDFIGAQVNLGGIDNMEDALEATWGEIIRSAHNTPWWDGVRQVFQAFNINVTMFGSVQFSFPQERRRELLTAGDFAANLGGFVKKMGERCRGLFIVWDDINGLAEKPEFAHWLKSFVESEADLSAVLTLAGLEERRAAIVNNNPSAARIFGLINVAPWSDGEAADFFERAFSKGGIALTKDQINQYLVLPCGGLPVLAHELGDAVWGQLAKHEGIESVLKWGLYHAVQNVGEKWLKTRVLDALKSEGYLRLLGALKEVSKARFGAMQFSRAELMENLPKGVASQTADNFLVRMKKLGALTLVENARGEYRFPNFLYYFYLCHMAPAIPKKGLK